MKSDNTLFWLIIGILIIAFITIFGISLYYFNSKRKKRVGSIEKNFCQNPNAFEKFIGKQRSLKEKSEIDRVVSTISVKEKASNNENNIKKKQVQNFTIPTNSPHPLVPQSMTKKVPQLQKVARSVSILSNTVKKENNIKNKNFFVVDEENTSNEKVNPFNFNRKSDEKKTVSEIESDNLLKDTVLFKDIQAEEEKHRKEAKRRGLDEDSYVFQSMKRIQNVPTNVSIKSETILKEDENTQTEKNTSTTTDTSALKQARALLECDILHKDIEAEEEKKKEEARKRGFDTQSTISIIS
uniref:Uncharacterized protein n=1 Tax=Strongyloides venezuelensis TaxID=75913 RepID=A0A0K0FV43_STRVS